MSISYLLCFFNKIAYWAPTRPTRSAASLSLRERALDNLHARRAAFQDRINAGGVGTRFCTSQLSGNVQPFPFSLMSSTVYPISVAFFQPFRSLPATEGLSGTGGTNLDSWQAIEGTRMRQSFSEITAFKPLFFVGCFVWTAKG